MTKSGKFSLASNSFSEGQVRKIKGHGPKELYFPFLYMKCIQVLCNGLCSLLWDFALSGFKMYVFFKMSSNGSKEIN